MLSPIFLFSRILRFCGRRSVFNDHAEVLLVLCTSVHPSCSNHRSKEHFVGSPTCFKKYRPGLMDISEQAGTKVRPDQLGPPVRVGSTRIDSDQLGSNKKIKIK